MSSWWTLVSPRSVRPSAPSSGVGNIPFPGRAFALRPQSLYRQITTPVPAGPPGHRVGFVQVVAKKPIIGQRPCNRFRSTSPRMVFWYVAVIPMSGAGGFYSRAIADGVSARKEVGAKRRRVQNSMGIRMRSISLEVNSIGRLVSKPPTEGTGVTVIWS